ncbi:MAG: hypothetical protein DRN25_07365 [Thermoplasmata archaeon]|nr:MAG: hypothetical protein DRN25_07365 [Thermoplasmata archaeon]
MKKFALLVMLMVIAGCVSSKGETKPPEEIQKNLPPLENATKKEEIEKNKSVKNYSTIEVEELSSLTAKDSISSISGDGEYIAIGSWDDNIYLLKETEVLWRYRTRGSVYGVALCNGKVVATSFIINGGKLYLLFINGTPYLEKDIPDLCSGVSCLGDLILIGCRDGNLYAYNSHGDLVWKFETKKSAWGIWDVETHNGTIALACDDTYVYTLNASGDLIWKASAGRKSYLYGVDVYNSGIAVASQDGFVYFYRGGSLLWKFKTGFSNSAVKFSPDGEYIAVGSWDKNLYILNREGKLMKKVNVGSEINDIVFGEDMIILGLKSGEVKFFRWNTSYRSWSH